LLEKYQNENVEETIIHKREHSTEQQQKQEGTEEQTNAERNGKTMKVLSSPRIIHKLNLLFNPQMLINPNAEKITGKYLQMCFQFIPLQRMFSF